MRARVLVRREARLAAGFSREDFERGFATFKQTYNVAPLQALCAPDVLARFCELYGRASDSVHQHSLRLAFDGVPLVAGVLAPGTIAFEGDVDEERMGDW
jgi:hypothetical protein